ncbi:ABC transporter ATP-binding protein [Litorilinea aerophila]|uniref:Spermidine/putrescine import ATP-binding protein PotA n=1 Tax=Litorilinea aerophila TaxID=1204385 RepID=A0A540VCY5_9CHLR|nr:ABC transporter ATP-binding protein [Litorilinea aerophila]MCC9077590.1 ABC transporter ATP-binding protein [Litorilinea aerophila]OUC09882.1 hypothetical protein RY27_00130 [Litorilinea aerophila]
MSDVRLEHVTFRYGDVMAADDVTLHVREGEFFALLGPSGSGKTTILRLVAGFLQPQSGAITIGGRPVAGIPPYERHIGFVFQHYALFPHMTVAENVAFGLESRGVPRAEIRRRVSEVLDLVQLTGLDGRRPAQLSGGQQQRVALARAIVTQPQVLLLDEPLAALDKKLRTQMQVELRQLQQRLGITTLFVTHDQEEALTLADRIAVMNQGRIAQEGPPRQVYERPRTLFVCDFLGEANILPGTVQAVTGDALTVGLAGGGQIQARGEQVAGRAWQPGASIICAVRPENVRLAVEAPATPFALEGAVEHIAYNGPSVNYHLRRAGGDEFVVFAQNGLLPEPPALGQRVYVTWDPAHTLVLEG